MAMFRDRVDAGRQLAQRLSYLRDENVVVLGLPRGGVPVAFEVAQALGAPLDVIVVRKLGVPSQPELAMGAVGEGGTRLVNTDVLNRARITGEQLRAVELAEVAQLADRVARYRRGLPGLDLSERTAVVVDDGMATGSTARAACEIAHRLGAAKVVLGVPVAATDVLRDFTGADHVVCVSSERLLRAVGFHYRDFRPTTDDEVMALLDAAGRRMVGLGDAGDPECDLDVELPFGPVTLHGHLQVPDAAAGVLVFANGGAHARHSQRTRLVAEVLLGAGYGTLLLDLLTPAEELERHRVFDIELMAHRLTAATEWLRNRPETAASRVGYVGAGTGAAAVLWAAAAGGADIGAVVSIDGRPDLAESRLADVRSPTLLIVSGEDESSLRVNRQAQALLRCPCRMIVLHDEAGHHLGDPGTTTTAATLARDWFTRYLLPDDSVPNPPTC